MAQVGRRDQGRAVIGAGHQPGVVAKFDCRRHRFRVIGNRCDCDRVIRLMIQRVHVGPGFGQGTQSISRARECRDMDRSSSDTVARLKVRARGGQSSNVHHVVVVRSIMQTCIGRNLGRAGRHLGERRRRETHQEQAEKNAHDMDMLARRYAPRQGICLSCDRRHGLRHVRVKRPIRRSSGNPRIHRPVTANVPAAPTATAATGPISAAIVPARNPPSSFEAPTKTPLTAFTPTHAARPECPKLHQHPAHIHADHIRASHQHQRHDRDPYRR